MYLSPQLGLTSPRAVWKVDGVLVRFGKILVVLALVAMLGAHWALLQTMAWTTMLADNLQSSSLHQALAKTFDGEHPCPICLAIAAGKKSEQKNEFTVKMQKMEFPPAEENMVLVPPAQFELLPLTDAFADLSSLAPPTPPPRPHFV